MTVSWTCPSRRTRTRKVKDRRMTNPWRRTRIAKQTKVRQGLVKTHHGETGVGKTHNGERVDVRAHQGDTKDGKTQQGETGVGKRKHITVRE